MEAAPPAAAFLKASALLLAAPPHAAAGQASPSPATSQEGGAPAPAPAAAPLSPGTAVQAAFGGATLLVQAAHAPTPDLRPAPIALIPLPLSSPSSAGLAAASVPPAVSALDAGTRTAPAPSGPADTGKATTHAPDGAPAKSDGGPGNGGVNGHEDAAPAAASIGHPDAGTSAASGAMRAPADPLPAASAAPPSSAAPAASSLPSPAIAQVDGSVRWMLQNGSQEAQLQLHPESLGQITINLRVEGGEVHARLWVSDPASMQAVQDGRSHLEQSLREQGLQLGSFDLHQGQRPYQDASAHSAPGLREAPAPTPARQETPTPTAPTLANPHQIECYA